MSNKLTKPFSLAQILSVTTGRLTCNMGGVYEILNHLTGDDLFTHVLPRASRFAEPLLLEDHPELAAAGSPESMANLDGLLKVAAKPTDALAEWLGGLMSDHGLKPEYELKSYSDSWLSYHPLTELATMVPASKILVAIPAKEGARHE